MKRILRTACTICAVAALVAVASGAGENKPVKPPPPQQLQFEHDMMVRYHMHENFDLLRAIEKLLVRGKLDEGRVFARAIAEAPDEPGLEAFAASAATVRTRALALARATTLDEALRKEAQLAEACAGCHAAASVLPEFREPPKPPPDQPTVEARMTRHLWATDRLWEGVVGDSEPSWRAGADVLAATPLPWPRAEAERAAYARQLQRLADQARRVGVSDQLAERARSYGEILVTCAGCHALPANAAPEPPRDASTARNRQP